MALLAIGASAQKWVGVPENRFAVTVRIDSAIASEPQKMYMYSMIEREMQLHDSISFDSLHREGTMHGFVPYEYIRITCRSSITFPLPSAHSA